MRLIQQKRTVDALSAQANSHAAEAARVRGILKHWTSSYFSSVDGLAWSFAMGAWWAAGRSPARDQADTARSRTLYNAANAGWLAWQLVNRQASWSDTPDDALSDITE